MADWVAIGIAALALIVSVVVAIREDRLRREQDKIQRRLADIEVARREEEVERAGSADVTAFIQEDRDPRGKRQWRFVLQNIGAAAAFDVGFEMSSPTGDEKPAFLGTDETDIVPRLDPGQKRPYPVAMFSGTGPKLDIALTWRDEQGEKEKTLQIGSFG